MGAPSAKRRGLEIGITDHAQSALGDLVFVEVPDVGRALQRRRSLRRGRVGQGGIGRLQSVGRQGHRQQRRAGQPNPNCSTRIPTGPDGCFAWRPAVRSSAASLMSAGAYASFLAEESK